MSEVLKYKNMETNGVPEIAKVGVRLPPFDATDPQLCFAVAKHSFEAAGITTEKTKFRYVASVLEWRYMREVKDVLLAPPDQPYSALKAALIQRLSAHRIRRTAGF